MRYLKKFDGINEYDAFVESDEYITPNVSLIGSMLLRYNPVHTPMYIEALEDLTVQTSNTYGNIYYSEDLSNWTYLGTNTIDITKGNKTYFYSTGSNYSPKAGIGTFVISGKCNVGGNCMSMRFGLDYDGQEAFTDNGGFQNLFANCSTIINAKDLILPATTLSGYVYRQMFSGCTSLETAPELPAQHVTGYKSNNNSYGAYEKMFYNCVSLEVAPKLPAESVDGLGYYSMFEGCINLKKVPELSVKTLTTEVNSGYHLSRMFYGCTSLTQAPELPATTLADYCYAYMFNGCTSLTQAPELPATTLAYYCYNYMFQNCTRLNYIKAMFTTTPSSSYTSSWVKGVASEGTFVKNAAATWNVTGVNGIPEGWTVETAEA